MVFVFFPRVQLLAILTAVLRLPAFFILESCFLFGSQSTLFQQAAAAITGRSRSRDITTVIYQNLDRFCHRSIFDQIYIKKKEEVYSSSATSKQWKYFLLYELMKMYLKVFNCFIYWTMLLVLKWWKWTYSSPNTFSLYDIQKFVTFRTYMFKKKKNNVLLLHSSKRLT